MTFLLMTLTVFLGSSTRALVGSGRSLFPKPVTYLLASVLCASIGLGLAPSPSAIHLLAALWAALAVTVSLSAGYTNWEKTAVMLPRLAIPSLFVVMPLMYTIGIHLNFLIYVLFSIGVALLYPRREAAYQYLLALKIPYYWQWVADPVDPAIVHRKLRLYTPFSFFSSSDFWDSARLAECASGAAHIGLLPILFI